MVDRGRLDAVGVGNDVEGVVGSRRADLEVVSVVIDGRARNVVVQKRSALLVSYLLVYARSHVSLVYHTHAVDPKGNRDDEEEDEDSEADEDALEPVGDGNLGRVVHVIHTLTNPCLIAFDVAVANGFGGIAENILQSVFQVARPSSSVVAESLLVFEKINRFVAVDGTSTVERLVGVEGIRLELEIRANL